jgi:hypothetical protein
LPDFEAEFISVPGNCAQCHSAYILVSKNLNCNSGQMICSRCSTIL